MANSNYKQNLGLLILVWMFVFAFAGLFVAIDSYADSKVPACFRLEGVHMPCSSGVGPVQTGPGDACSCFTEEERSNVCAGEVVGSCPNERGVCTGAKCCDQCPPVDSYCGPLTVCGKACPTGTKPPQCGMCPAFEESFGAITWVDGEISCTKTCGAPIMNGDGCQCSCDSDCQPHDNGRCTQCTCNPGQECHAAQVCKVDQSIKCRKPVPSVPAVPKGCFCECPPMPNLPGCGGC